MSKMLAIKKMFLQFPSQLGGKRSHTHTHTQMLFIQLFISGCSKIWLNWSGMAWLRHSGLPPRCSSPSLAGRFRKPEHWCQHAQKKVAFFGRVITLHCDGQMNDAVYICAIFKKLEITFLSYFFVFLQLWKHLWQAHLPQPSVVVCKKKRWKDGASSVFVHTLQGLKGSDRQHNQHERGVCGVAVTPQRCACGRCCQPRAGPSFTFTVPDIIPGPAECTQTQANQHTKNREVGVCVCVYVGGGVETGVRQVKEKARHSKSCMRLV